MAKRKPNRTTLPGARAQPQPPAPVAGAEPGRSRRAELIAVGILLLVVTAWVFLPTLRNDFLQYDDPQYVTENAAVTQGLSWQGVAWAFRTGEQSNWHPLTWLSHMLDVQLFGVRAAAHHLVNLAFHCANTLLLFLVLSRMTGAVWRCALVAGLFALHPLHVESVAWVAERKDVLSTFFGLLSIWAYVRYARKSDVQGSGFKVQGSRFPFFPSILHPPSSTFYILSLLLFACSLLSKPTLVTFPFLLLLLDYWPLDRWQLLQGSRFKVQGSKFLLLEKLPFLVLAAASSAITLSVQQPGGAMRTLELLPLGARLANAALGYLAYLQKTFWPTALAVVYPLPAHRPGWQVAVAALVLAALTLGVVLARRRRYLLVGWLWFLGTLVPMIGLVQVGDQAIADRYTYLPLVGLFVALIWGLSELCAGGWWRRFALGLGMLAALGGCAVLTARQLGLWQNTETLMRHALAVTTNNYVAYNNLATYYWDQGKTDEVIQYSRKSLAIVTRLEALNNMGLALAKQGKFNEAIGYYETAVRARPEEFGVRLNLADVLAATGKLDESIIQYEAAVRLKPNVAAIHNELAFVLANRGRYDEAIAHYQTALRLQPNYPEARTALAMTLTQAGRAPEAAEQYQAMLRANPTNVEALHNLGIALSLQGESQDAITQFREVLRLDPTNATAYANLGNALATQNKLSEAIDAFRIYVRLQPDNARGHRSLGRALYEQSQLDEALAELTASLGLSPNDPETHYYVGLIHDRLGHTNDALRAYNTALSINPNSPMVHYTLGLLNERRGKTDEAILDLTTSLRLHAANPDGQYRLGLLLQRQGKTNDALAHYQQALRLKPDFPEARKQLDTVAPAGKP